MGLECATRRVNISTQPCPQKWGSIVGGALFPNTTSAEYQALYATETSMLTESNWTDAINASTDNRCSVLPQWKNVHTAEWENADDTFAEGNLTNREKTAEGARRLVITYKNNSAKQNNDLYSLDGQRMYWYPTTKKNFILSNSENGITHDAIEVDVFVSNVTFQSGDAEINGTKVMIDILDLENGLIDKDINPSKKTTDAWKITELDGIKDAELTIIGSAIATTIVVDANVINGGQGVEGATAVGDWLLETGTVDSVVADANIPNRYTLTCTGAAGTLSFAGQPAMTLKGYETPTPVATEI